MGQAVPVRDLEKGIGAEKFIFEEVHLEKPSQVVEMPRGPPSAKYDFAGGASVAPKGVSELRPTHFPDKTHSEMQNLIDNIREHGITDPIKYIEHQGENFIVDGHHRFFSARKIGLENIPTQKVELPYGKYMSPADFVMDGKMPKYWQKLK